MIAIEQPEVVFVERKHSRYGGRRRYPFTWYRSPHGAMVTCCTWMFVVFYKDIDDSGLITCLSECCNRPGVLKGFKCN